MADVVTEAKHRRHRKLPVLERPRTVGECRDGLRPSPYVSCRFHLLVDDDERGRIHLRTPGQPSVVLAEDAPPNVVGAAIVAAVEAWTAPETPPPSCVIEEVEKRHDHLLEEIGEILGISHERVRQIETGAMSRVRKQRAQIN